MTSVFIRQFWSGLGCSSFLRPIIQFQPSIRTKMVRRINRNRVPTHAKPNDKWVQKKTVYEMKMIIDSMKETYVFIFLELDQWKLI